MVGHMDVRGDVVAHKLVLGQMDARASHINPLKVGSERRLLFASEILRRFLHKARHFIQDFQDLPIH